MIGGMGNDRPVVAHDAERSLMSKAASGSYLLYPTGGPL